MRVLIDTAEVEWAGPRFPVIEKAMTGLKWICEAVTRIQRIYEETTTRVTRRGRTSGGCG